MFAVASCTPQQAKTAADAAGAAVRIAGAVCSVVGKTDKAARFACDVVDAGSQVLGNTDTTGAQGYKRPSAAHFEVEVPIEQADAFAKANGGTK